MTNVLIKWLNCIFRGVYCNRPAMSIRTFWRKKKNTSSKKKIKVNVECIHGEKIVLLTSVDYDLIPFETNCFILIIYKHDKYYSGNLIWWTVVYNNSSGPTYSGFTLIGVWTALENHDIISGTPSTMLTLCHFDRQGRLESLLICFFNRVNQCYWERAKYVFEH